MGDVQVQLLLALVLGYLLGSIPFGVILTRLSGKGDVRKVGSGNIGATNVLRAAGKGAAAATLVLDMLKGVAAVWLARSLLPGVVGAEDAAAAGALIGHLYPVWLSFRGGKGVATLFGILIGLMPSAAVIYAGVWVATLMFFRISSLAGIAAAASAPVGAAIFSDSERFALSLAFALIVIWKHHDNIARIRSGTEPKLGRKRG